MDKSVICFTISGLVCNATQRSGAVFNQVFPSGF
jgi:hypothetical protein